MIKTESRRYVNASYFDTCHNARVNRIYYLPVSAAVMWANGWTAVVIRKGDCTGLYTLSISYHDHDHCHGARAVKEITGQYAIVEAHAMARKLVRWWH